VAKAMVCGANFEPSTHYPRYARSRTTPQDFDEQPSAHLGDLSGAQQTSYRDPRPPFPAFAPQTSHWGPVLAFKRQGEKGEQLCFST
jgi:hypothetical protein